MALWGVQLAAKSRTLKTASAVAPVAAAAARIAAENFILMVESFLIETWVVWLSDLRSS